MKMFIQRFILAGFLFFSTVTPGFSEPCAPLQGFSNVMGFDRIASGQIVSLHDCDSDGLAEYRSIWTVVEFGADPVACQDPYDSRHLIVPRSGYYRLLADPARVEILLKNKGESAQPKRVPLIPMRDTQ